MIWLGVLAGMIIGLALGVTLICCLVINDDNRRNK